MRRIIAICLTLLLLPAWAVAQEDGADDKDRLTRFLESSLSGAGRSVQIDGFAGALSSRATMTQMTISDDEGVWLTLTDVALSWNRLAVLRGRIEIAELSAAEIAVPRLPVSNEPPSPEARPFSLPELPVSVNIGLLQAESVVLGAPLLGSEVTVSVDGNLRLEAGEGAAALTIARIDGPRGAFTLDAGYANATGVLDLDLGLSEGADGIAANLLGLPGRPALDLAVQGSGPLDDFAADVSLRSDGQTRLAGQVVLGTEPSEGAAAPDAGAPPAPETAETPPPAIPPVRIVRADIAGDLAPLFAPQYRDFFGDRIALNTLVRLFPDGRVTLERLALEAAELQVNGTLALAPGGLPERFDVRLRLDGAAGPVLLPLSGPETRVAGADLSARFDAAAGDRWVLTGDVRGLDRPDLRVTAVALNGDGTINAAAPRRVTATVNLAASGIAPADPALASAIGPAAQLTAEAAWQDGGALRLPVFRLSAGDVTVAGTARLDGAGSATTVSGDVQARIGDLARFAGLAGQPLSGGLSAGVRGDFTPLSGAFDLVLSATGTDLAAGIARVDPLLRGDSTLAISARRDTDGITLRQADVRSAAVTASAAGTVATGDSDLTYDVALDNLARFVAGLSGPATLRGTARQTGADWAVLTEVSAPDGIEAEADVKLPGGGPLTADVTGRIGSLARLVPGLTGGARFDLSAAQAGEDWQVAADAVGPGGATVRIAGRVRGDASTAALDLNGTVPLILANRFIAPRSVRGDLRFDLALNGPLQPQSLSGTISTSGARLSAPTLQNALEQIDATLQLSGGRAAVTLRAEIDSGGRLRVDGPIGLTAPYTANLDIGLDAVRVVQSRLYETSIDGEIALTGPLAGTPSAVGRLVLGPTEVQVPSAGVGISGELPEITHLGEPGAVRQTRRNAGLLDTRNGASGGPGINLDIRIDAANQIFLRGRGIDAEFGGGLRVTGTTSDIVPIGQFNLIRGRVDILGKRLDLVEGRARLEGNLVPTIRLVASTVVDDTTVSIIVEGRADAPDITFTSAPELPQEEVLSRLLFGRDIASISVLQAAQLANSVAVLAGRSGVGVIERVRRSTGIDELDVTTTDSGAVGVRIGKYLSENIYTDITVADQGQSTVNLNLDLTPQITAKGTLGEDGTTGLGVFFQKDY